MLCVTLILMWFLSYAFLFASSNLAREQLVGAAATVVDSMSNRQLEIQLHQQLNDTNERLRNIDEEINAEAEENEHLTGTVEGLRDMRQQLDEELTALAPLSTEAIEAARYEANEIRKTILENELVQTESTLRFFAMRIQDLIKQRVERDAQVENFHRRIMAMQRLINRPRGQGVLTSAVRELRQLEQDNRNLQEKIIALKVATGDNPTAFGESRDNEFDNENLRNAKERKRWAEQEKEEKIQNQLEGTQTNLLQLEREEHLQKLSLEGRIAQTEQQLRLEHENKIRELTTAYESSRLALLVSTRNKEERQSTNVKDILKRALVSTKKASGAVSSKKTPEAFGEEALEVGGSMPSSHVSRMASERAKTSAAARSIASQVSTFQSLQDESSVLQGLVAKMATQVQETNKTVRDMAEQLEKLQSRLMDETRNRDIWIQSDAQQFNEGLVKSIVEKDEELKALQSQVAEWAQHTENLKRRTPGGGTSSGATGVSPLLNSAVSLQSPSGRSFAGSGSATMHPDASSIASSSNKHQQEVSALKRSIWLDL